jgi:hypothetical protein
LIGLPWRSSPTLGNFNGKLVYTPDEQTLSLSGHFNLYNCSNESCNVSMRVIVDGRVYDLDVTGLNRSFSSELKIDQSHPADMEARLEVDGEVVATGRISLPQEGTPGIHIIRFSSLS